MNFEGDLLLIDTPDGGDLVLNEGLLMPDRSFFTAVYLSLFGGNKDDAGKVKTNKTWWGNTLDETTEAEKIVSRFQHIITAMPLTVKNVKAAIAAAKIDLKWILEFGIADQIEAEGQVKEKGFFVLYIKILNNKNTIFENNYLTLWTGGNYGV